MSDISQTAANVLKSTPAQDKDGTSGEALTAGNAIYMASNSRWLRTGAGNNAQISGTTEIGIVLNSAPGTGQPIRIFKNGKINLGATLTVGETYVVSRNLGRICPISDLATNDYVSILGVAYNASILQTPASGAFASGTQKA